MDRRCGAFGRYGGVAASLLVGGVFAAASGRDGLREWGWGVEVFVLSTYILCFQLGLCALWALVSNVCVLFPAAVPCPACLFSASCSAWFRLKLVQML